MKKFILVSLVAIFSIAIPISAQTRTDRDGNTISHYLFAVAQYQMDNFEYAEVSGSYGLGIVASSFSHWGRFHVGANVNFSINAGFVDYWGCIIDFGPSARIDINNHFFVNVPINAVCAVSFPKGTTDTEASWGARISPSIHAFVSKRFGFFAGPQVSFGFVDGSSAAFGMQAGISYSF